jgi:exopolysaccharide production protein ExoQ
MTHSFIKNAAIFVILLLVSGAFIDLIVDPSLNSTTTTSGDEHAQLMWGIVDCAVVIACVLHGRQFVRVASRQPWIVVFVAWSALSLAWSDFPLLTLRRIVGLICTMALGFLLGMRFEMKALLRLVVLALGVTIPLSFIAAICFPSYGIMHRMDAVGWRGVYNHKNPLGISMGVDLIAMACLLWESRQNRLMYQILLLPAAVLLLLSRSMTAIIVTAITLCLGTYLRLRLHRAHKVAVYAMGLLAGFAATIFLQGRLDSIFALIGRDSSLTGRIPLWQYSAAAVLERPIFGAGYDAFWPGKGGDYIRDLVRWPAPHAHNSFLELALNVGLVGLVIFLVCISKIFPLALRYSKDSSNPLRLWPLLFYTDFFLSCFTEAPAVDRHALTFVLFCAISVSMVETEAEATEYEQENEYMPSEIVADSGMIQESS